MVELDGLPNALTPQRVLMEFDSVPRGTKKVYRLLVKREGISTPYLSVANIVRGLVAAGKLVAVADTNSPTEYVLAQDPLCETETGDAMNTQDLQEKSTEGSPLVEPGSVASGVTVVTVDEVLHDNTQSSATPQPKRIRMLQECDDLYDMLYGLQHSLPPKRRKELLRLSHEQALAWKKELQSEVDGIEQERKAQRRLEALAVFSEVLRLKGEDPAKEFLTKMKEAFETFDKGVDGKLSMFQKSIDGRIVPLETASRAPVSPPAKIPSKGAYWWAWAMKILLGILLLVLVVIAVTVWGPVMYRNVDESLKSPTSTQQDKTKSGEGSIPTPKSPENSKLNGEIEALIERNKKISTQGE